MLSPNQIRTKRWEKQKGVLCAAGEPEYPAVTSAAGLAQSARGTSLVPGSSCDHTAQGSQAPPGATPVPEAVPAPPSWGSVCSHCFPSPGLWSAFCWLPRGVPPPCQLLPAFGLLSPSEQAGPGRRGARLLFPDRRRVLQDARSPSVQMRLCGCHLLWETLPGPRLSWGPTGSLGPCTDSVQTWWLPEPPPLSPAADCGCFCSLLSARHLVQVGLCS